jgi:hypothetical protein
VTFAWVAVRNMATAFVSGKKRERIKNLSKYKKRWVKHEDTHIEDDVECTLNLPKENKQL